MKKELRYFQNDCINAIIEALKNKNSVPYVNCVTGFGKSIVMADLTERALNKNKRILQLVPNHTLCLQNYDQTFSYITNKRSLGICSAKLGKYEINKQAVIATQTSFLKRRTYSGSFDVLLCDECDMISPIHETTYQKIIKSLLRINPNMRIVGMTGSPYREDQGMIHDKVKDGNVIFTECCYESDIPKLIKEGFLSHIDILNNNVSVNLDGIKKKGKDYDQQECGIKFDKIIQDAVIDFKKLFDDKNIKTALIFASTIANGERIVKEYNNINECKIAHGNLSNNDRNELLKWLKNGSGKRYLVNVGLYTRGFDFPELQALVLLRATTSLRLYVQIIGRLIRSHDEKECGYLLDYGTNVSRFGPIDNLTPPEPPKNGEAPKKICTAILDENVDFEGVTYLAGNSCNYLNNLSARKCKKCEALFISDNEEGKYSMRTKAQVLALEQEKKRFTYDVESVLFERHQKGDVAMIKMLFYDKYELLHTEYICIEHTGSARGLAIAKLKSLMKNPRQDWYQIGKFEGSHNVKNMLFLLENYYDQYFKCVKAITIIKEGRFNKLEEWFFDEQNYA
jgi:DNA repair protein RadD